MTAIGRRCYLEKMTKAERAIYDAMQAVEEMPPDVRLTDAVVLLGHAKDRVADYVDDVPRRHLEIKMTEEP